VSETVYAGPGSWVDNTEWQRARESVLAEIERSVRPGWRAFYVRCGGCPWGEQIVASDVALEEYPMPGLMALCGWQASPLRCGCCLVEGR
jgi:hypothetical protein